MRIKVLVYLVTMVFCVSWVTVSEGKINPSKISLYSNVAVVAPSGGDYDNPATAMSNYASWCGSPSATNPFLLMIMPGVYAIGTSAVMMQPYIDIEGSGENVTVIQGNVNSVAQGVVNGASNAELRFLTVKNVGGGTSNRIAIYNSNSCPKLTNVTATASDGINYGVYNSSSSPTMTNVTATALSLEEGGCADTYGVFNDSSGTVKINHSVIKGENSTISNASGATTLVGDTQLDGGVVGNLGTLTCVGAYNGSYVALGTNCL